jgi:hypothetical protein
MCEARADLEGKPEQAEADQHIRQLERLLSHGDTWRGHPNLSANAVVRNAKGFLYNWNDHGFSGSDAKHDQ